MKEILITRQQFEQIKKVFEDYNPDHVIWEEQSTSGIGPTVSLRFVSQKPITVDITDIESW